MQQIGTFWIGGSSGAAMKRASRLGDGWHPVGVAPAQIERGVKIMRKMGRKVTISLRVAVDLKGGPTSHKSVSGQRMVSVTGSRQDIVRSIEEYSSAGVEHFVVSLDSSDSEQLFQDVKKFSSDIVRSFK